MEATMPPKTNQDMASKNKEDRQSKKPWVSTY